RRGGCSTRREGRKEQGRQGREVGCGQSPQGQAQGRAGGRRGQQLRACQYRLEVDLAQARFRLIPISPFATRRYFSLMSLPQNAGTSARLGFPRSSKRSVR